MDSQRRRLGPRYSLPADMPANETCALAPTPSPRTYDSGAQLHNPESQNEEARPFGRMRRPPALAFPYQRPPFGDTRSLPPQRSPTLVYPKRQVPKQTCVRYLCRASAPQGLALVVIEAIHQSLANIIQ